MILPTIPLPLPPNGPPQGYACANRDMSDISTTTAFRTGLKGRDVFLGEQRCVVCGEEDVQHCHVIMQSQNSIVTILKWIYFFFPQAHTKFSGMISSAVIGFRTKPKKIQRMNLVMDWHCAPTTTRPSTITIFLSATFLQWVWLPYYALGYCWKWTNHL